MEWPLGGRGEAGHKGGSGVRQKEPALEVGETGEESFLEQVIPPLRASMCSSVKWASLEEVSAALFTTAKRWKHPKCPATDE